MVVVNVILATVNVRDLKVIQIGKDLVEVDGLGLFNDGDVERGMDTSISRCLRKAGGDGTKSQKGFADHSFYYILTKQ